MADANAAIFDETARPDDLSLLPAPNLSSPLVPDTTPEALQQIIEQFRDTDRLKFDYILARSGERTVQHALAKITPEGMHPRSLRMWYDRLTDAEQVELEVLANRLHAAVSVNTWFVLENAAVRAAQVKVEGLDSNDAKIRQGAATEILNRVLDRPIHNPAINVAQGMVILWNPHKPAAELTGKT